MIEVSFWSEKEKAYYCHWDGFSGFLTEEDLKHEEQVGEDVVWHCAP